MEHVLTIAHLTLAEARRRRILVAATGCGLAALLVFAIGYFFIHRDVQSQAATPLVQRRIVLQFLCMAGLYAVNFLMVMTAVLLPVDTVSGEIGSGVMQTLAAKPVRRVEILLGKWIAYALVLGGYLVFMAGGILAIARLIAGLTPPHIERGLPLMLLEGLVLMTVSIAGGTRLSTIANGILAFGLYGLAFVGSWTEQIGAMTGNAAARSLGTAASLVMPSESMWQLAAWHMQPPLVRELHLSPFAPASVPNAAMVAWACGYIIVTLALALWTFHRRDL